MQTWKVSLINPILNFRRIVIVDADSYLHAIDSAENLLKRYGYIKIEYCIVKP